MKFSLINLEEIINIIAYPTSTNPKNIEIKNKRGLIIGVKYGRIKNNIATNEKIIAIIVDFLTPILIAKV